MSDLFAELDYVIDTRVGIRKFDWLRNDGHFPADFSKHSSHDVPVESRMWLSELWRGFYSETL